MSYFHKKSLYRKLFLGLFLGLILAMIFATTLGAADLSFRDSLHIFAERIPLLRRLLPPSTVADKYQVILWQVRMPRILLAATVGMGLSVVGAALQGLFKNPMADPYIMGVSSGAALGASLGITLLGLGILQGGFTVQLMAFIGALLTVYLVYEIAKVGHRVPITMLILAGVAISAMASAMISILLLLNRDQADQIIFWTMGSVAAARWKQLMWLMPLVMGSSLWIYSYGRTLNLLLSGEDAAHGLGVDVEKTKKQLLFISSITVAFVVSVSGIIGFVGLIVPHGVRLVLGGDHRVLLPFSALMGALFMVFSDTLARTLLAPMEIPVGAVTALFGAPYFIFLLYRAKRKGGFI